jgi:hypothetical protein
VDEAQGLTVEDEHGLFFHSILLCRCRCCDGWNCVE